MYRQTLNPLQFQHNTARTRLRRAIQEASERPAFSWLQWLRSGTIARTTAYVGLALIMTAAVGRDLISSVSTSISNTRLQSQALLVFALGASNLPNKGLTPGIVRESSANVCTTEHEEVVKPVSAELRQKVLNEYGMSNANSDDYEIDYLIAPDLGGQADIQNLWPQPKKSAVWDSKAKDALEERLHGLVCSGQLDISTARHDIASNWIEAYQKYFKTDQPQLPHSITVSSLGRDTVAVLTLRRTKSSKP
jgi:hypothetical protein